jgi:hypothetical protein
MSFTGDLEHLPIVDVIQLLHSTRKTGTLSIKSSKGESQLVFSDGYLASANHLNNSVRIGQVLIDMKSITQENLDQALQEQKRAGTERKPLIATLIEQSTIGSEEAYKGLEYLIEMTIVEVLTWTSGTFALDVEKTEVNDEYRYFPETLKQEILLNVQGILMDALRIYDEKMRDGTLEEIFFAPPQTDEQSTVGDDDQSVTADLLGLDSLDTMKKKIPDVFIGLKDHDPMAEHRAVVAEALGSLPAERQAALCAFLNQFSSLKPMSGSSGDKSTLPLAIIVFSHDPFLTHAISTISRHKGHVVFTTDEDANLDLIIEQSFARDLLPVLVVDDPECLAGGYTGKTIIFLIQQKQEAYPLLPILQLDATLTDYSFPQSEHVEKTGAVFPRPIVARHPETFVTDMTALLEAFSAFLSKFSVPPERRDARKLNECVAALAPLRDAPEVARELLNYMSSQFERVVTLVVGATDLTAEKSIGVSSEKSNGPGDPLLFKIPLGQRSVFQDTIDKNRTYYGLCSDALMKNHLHAEIGAPRSSKVILLPLHLSGKVIALLYGDFGQKTPTPVQIELLEVASRFAGLVLDNSFHRKKLDKLTRRI